MLNERENSRLNRRLEIEWFGSLGRGFQILQVFKKEQGFPRKGVEEKAGFCED